MRLVFAIVISIFLNLSAVAQLPLRSADKDEYVKYLAYCNTQVYREIEQYSKITLKKINGQYTDSLNRWYAIEPIKVFTYKQSTKQFFVQENELLFKLKLGLYVRQRQPSIDDFYKNWKTKLLP